MYSQMLKKLSEKHNAPIEEIEKEMQNAVNAAGLNCSAEELIILISCMLSEKLK